MKQGLVRSGFHFRNTIILGASGASRIKHCRFAGGRVVEGGILEACPSSEQTFSQKLEIGWTQPAPGNLARFMQHEDEQSYALNTRKATSH